MKKNIAHILIIEDEPDIIELSTFNLEKHGYVVSSARNGEAGLEKTRKIGPDLILLDLMLPGIHGLDVLRILKSDKDTHNIPIIITSALGEEENIVRGLETGADDYITKPFSSVILLARVKAVLRRGLVSKIDLQRIVINQGIKVDPNTRNVFIDDSKVVLTFTEFQILYLLVSHPGWVFTRYQIIDRIRGEKYPVTDRAVDFQIVGLRKKMGHKGKLIETIRGVGYRFHLNET